MPAKSPVATSYLKPALKFRFVNGAAAGNITVTGIRTQDVLMYVGGFTVTNGTPDVVASLADLTSEFTISAADTINNTGGTSSANGALLVVWLQTPTKLDTI